MKRRYAIGLLVVALLLALLLARRREPPAKPVVQEPTATRAEPPVRPPRARAPAKRPSGDQASQASCVPGAERACLENEVWLLDSCGTPERMLEACSGECIDDRCESEPTRCSEPPEGRCAGDVVRLCVSGRPLAIDCAARGMRCRTGGEGAECAPRVPPELQCTGEDRCEDDVLVRCVEGAIERVPCAELRAHCATPSGETRPRCVAEQLAVPSACGPCGCAQAGRENRCDGRDEDGDGLIDEGLDCGDVPIIAFVVQPDGGRAAPSRELIEAEIAQANAKVAASGGEGVLAFTLARVVELAVPELRELDQDEFARLAEDERIQGASDDFYIPVLFTDTILAGGEVPKPGVSTLPNGTCGGMQQGYGPEGGLVAVSQLRYPTTLAHELGHYLGLCHTHDEQRAEPFVLYRDAHGDAGVSCGETCSGSGDGICDTPDDPGPERCSYDQACSVVCAPEAQPDVHNVMSYYALCRERFSAEQIALMQHTAALRRGFHRCRDGRCACVPASASCPSGMSCRPALVHGQSALRCALDGSRALGASCKGQSECGHELLCVTNSRDEQRCVRTCARSQTGCRCVPIDAAISICAEDLRSP